MSNYPDNKVTIVGGGIVGAIEAYFAHLDAKKNNRQVRVTIFDKNNNISQTTAYNIAPSLTTDEIMSVVPRGNALVEKLGFLFNQPGGIRVGDVPGINDSEVASKFISQVQEYSKDEEGHAKRSAALLQLGKVSMDLWQQIYDEADPELKQILEESNFNPCREPKNIGSVLHDGYRIDLIYNIPNAAAKAEMMKNDYSGLGYTKCKILSPAEVKAMDPFLNEFCINHSQASTDGNLTWNNDTVALYRPGGCIDAEIFLPKFYAYLQKAMGKYTNEDGVQKDCFRLKFERNVNSVVYADGTANPTISGVKYGDIVKSNKHIYSGSEYVFCPGEAVGTLNSLGFDEPAYSGFAGASLKLNIPIPADKLEQYSKFNHCMEVHQEGVVLAWQARFRDNKIFIGVAGTKAFYGDKKPSKYEDFAKDRNLLQLNMINDVLPEFISLALQKDTSKQKLTAADLKLLEDSGIATRWVGTRAVAYDGFPTLGALYSAKGKIENARCTTHLGSGGASFAPAAVVFSRNTSNKDRKTDVLESDVGKYSSSQRNAPTLKI